MRKIFIALLTLTLIIPAVGVQADISSAVTYLKQQSPNEWITQALVAAGETNVDKTYLQTFTGTSATDYAKRILAIVAVGENPTTFAGTDLVQGLKNLSVSNQIGDTSLLNDDAWGILALRAAGVSAEDSVIASSKQYLLNHQEVSGAWGYALGSGGDTNDTSAVIMAFISAGESLTSTAISNAKNYLHTTQNTDGGFPYSIGTEFGSESDSGSTAWVMSALNKLGEQVTTWNKGDNTPATFLAGLQTADGSYKWQASDTSGSVAMTASAVVALSGKSYPVVSQVISTSSPQINFRIEGASAQVCQGSLQAADALTVVEKASVQCGFTYHIQTMSFGPYLDQIGSDTAQGAMGWSYLVNYQSPSVGARDYHLQTGDSVLWFYGEYNLVPTRLTLQSTQIGSGQSTTATVESFSNQAWSPLSDAQVVVGSSTFTTNASGQISFNPADGYFRVYAKKDGFIRSDLVALQVGTPLSSSAALSANIVQGQVLGDSTSVAFNINTQALDFGNLNPGSTTSKTVTISNTGSSPIAVATTVEGDILFKDNIKVGDASWRNFSASLIKSENKAAPVSLHVPSDYTGSGVKSGSIIFWAMAQ